MITLDIAFVCASGHEFHETADEAKFCSLVNDATTYAVATTLHIMLCSSCIYQTPSCSIRQNGAGLSQNTPKSVYWLERAKKLIDFCEAHEMEPIVLMNTLLDR